MRLIRTHRRWKDTLPKGDMIRVNIDAESPIALPTIESGIVRDSWPCLHCSYDLRGLILAGSCPECGTAVEASIKGNLLRHAAPPYVTTVRQGHSLILLAVLIAMMAGTLMFASLGGGPQAVGAMRSRLFLQTVLLGAHTMALAGYLKATTPDPGSAWAKRPYAAWVSVRMAAYSNVIAQVLAVVLGSLELQGTSGRGPSMMVARSVEYWMATVAWLVLFIAMTRYEWWLGDRLPDAYFRIYGRRYMWVVPILMAPVAAVFVMPGDVYALVMPAALSWLVAIVLYWNLLRRMRRHLKSIEATGAPAAVTEVFW